MATDDTKRMFSGRSDILAPTTCPAGKNPREDYLADYASCPEPVIVHSELVPKELVVHLMRKKKRLAIGVKFESGDAITNMEGACHTFVTPLVPVWMHGDYHYSGTHGVVHFPTIDNPALGSVQRARFVVLSALVQPDFENSDVMLHVSALTDDAVQAAGEAAPTWPALNSVDRSNPKARAAYDEGVRRCLIAALVEGGSLPSRGAAASSAISPAKAISMIESHIRSTTLPSNPLKAVFVDIGSSNLVSLELLHKSAYHQARNELSGLDRVCQQGFVYTFQPPSIFARCIGATLLNRLQFLAIRQLCERSDFSTSRLRVYAFSDYADAGAIPLLRKAFERRPAIQVMKREDLYPAPEYLYRPPASAREAVLVIHNNSDGFGQVKLPPPPS